MRQPPSGRRRCPLPNTPDRFPGPLQESEEILLSEQSVGTTPSALGGLIFVDGAFKLRDAVGDFDPRSGGGGITESQHEVLDTLTHEIVETSYDEVTYVGGNVSAYVVWETVAKLKKVREELYNYASGKVSQAVTIQYDATGVEKARTTEVYTYTGSKITSVTRTKV